MMDLFAGLVVTTLTSPQKLDDRLNDYYSDTPKGVILKLHKTHLNSVKTADTTLKGIASFNPTPLNCVL
jgi:hypothetical protein